jgi:pimeloyl-ACP methyl ester carboxylesterase
VPRLILWGERDRVIPVEHGRDAHAAMPGSRLDVLVGAGHFPHLDDPQAVARALGELVADFEPAESDEDRMRERLRVGAA